MSLKYKKSSARGQWQVQEAKARFSELFRTARSAGPQRVSHHGKEVVVVLAEEDFLGLQRKKARHGSLVDFFAHSPLAKTKVDLSRNKDQDRPIHLSSGFLLDTNVISELVKPKPHPHVVRWVNEADEDSLFLSVLTLGEIRKGIALLPQGPRKSHLEIWLEKDLPERFLGRVLSVTDRIADRWGLMTARTQTRGKPIHVIDGLLAATALEHNLILATRNLEDVEPTGVPFQNPWE